MSRRKPKHRSLGRRIEELEATRPRQWFRPGFFLLYKVRLPEDTVVPPGGRVVEDTCAFDEPPGDDFPSGCYRTGFKRERITFDPTDEGRICERADWEPLEYPDRAAEARDAAEQTEQDSAGTE